MVSNLSQTLLSMIPQLTGHRKKSQQTPAKSSRGFSRTFERRACQTLSTLVRWQSSVGVIIGAGGT